MTCAYLDIKVGTSHCYIHYLEKLIFKKFPKNRGVGSFNSNIRTQIFIYIFYIYMIKSQ